MECIYTAAFLTHENYRLFLLSSKYANLDYYSSKYANLDYYFSNLSEVPQPHVTLDFKPDDTHSDLFGQKVIFKITGYGQDMENAGFSVECVDAESEELFELFKKVKTPHITYAYDMGFGRSYNTKNLAFMPLSPEDQVEVVGYFNGAFAI